MTLSSRIEPATGEVTQLLHSWNRGDETAAERLLPFVYAEMRRIAGRLIAGERSDHTLQATAVAHEAWIQLVGSRGLQTAGLDWQNRGHFLGVAARAMRHVLVDSSRRRQRAKRGAGFRRVPLTEAVFAVPSRRVEILDLHSALQRLEQFSPLDAQVVELRFFGGLTLEETAEAVGVSRRTVVRVWRRARAWLRAELAGSDGETCDDA